MTNVKLSKEELALVTDAGFILTKNRIIQKVYELFGDLSEEFRERSKQLPSAFLAASPKISKGENYLGFPWVMLDYPRAFSKADVFAIRCFFWWGKFFSITLQIHGSNKAHYSDAIKSYLALNPGEWWICIDNDPWQHHFESNNYCPYDAELDSADLPFIKLAKKIPLEQWDHSYTFFSITFQEILEMLSAKPVK
jgi:hypothetical protein